MKNIKDLIFPEHRKDLITSPKLYHFLKIFLISIFNNVALKNPSMMISGLFITIRSEFYT